MIPDNFNDVFDDPDDLNGSGIEEHYEGTEFDRHAADLVECADGAELLDLVRATIGRYCILPDDHAYVGVTLWTVLTHLIDEFEFAPRLVIRSAEKRSGKTRLVEVIAELVSRPLRTANATTAYIFRSIGRKEPTTLLFDEADTIFGTKVKAEQNEDLRGLLNAGFQRGTPFCRTVGPNHTPKEFDVFAMAALAGIGRMPDTIEDRAVVVVLKRRKADEKVHPYRTRRDRPRLAALREQIEAWVEQIRPQISTVEVRNMPVDDRAADVWEPLIAIADAAGGDWPRLARNAATAAVKTASEEDESESSTLLLLRDVRNVFKETGVSFIKSTQLITALCALEESPWNQWDLNTNTLARKLKPYGIKPKSNGVERGYRLDNCAEAFARYLGPDDDTDESES